MGLARSEVAQRCAIDLELGALRRHLAAEEPVEVFLREHAAAVVAGSGVDTQDDGAVADEGLNAEDARGCSLVPRTPSEKNTQARKSGPRSNRHVGTLLRV